MPIVDIRFNTKFPKESDLEWKVLVDGFEVLVNRVKINIPSYTTLSYIEGVGIKYHISAEANSVDISKNYGKIEAEIN